MRLENERLIIEIAEHGAELTRVLDKKNGEERLWNADATYWKRSSPVLFPNVGKVYGGIMHTDRGDCKIGQHGFARDMDFTCIASNDNNAVYKLRANDESYKKYPYSFLLRIEYELCDNDINVKWHVENEGEGEMSFTIGGHPAFVFKPEKMRKEEYCIFIPACNQLTYSLLDPSCGCAKADKTIMTLTDGYLNLSEALFENDALICDDGQIEEAWLCDKDHNRIVGIKAKGFPNFGIWSVKNAPFVCLEPWHGRCDDIGFSGYYGEKRNAVTLKNGESFDLGYTISIG